MDQAQNPLCGFISTAGSGLLHPRRLIPKTNACIKPVMQHIVCCCIGITLRLLGGNPFTILLKSDPLDKPTASRANCSDYTLCSINDITLVQNPLAPAESIRWNSAHCPLSVFALVHQSYKTVSKLAIFHCFCKVLLDEKHIIVQIP